MQIERATATVTAVVVAAARTTSIAAEIVKSLVALEVVDVILTLGVTTNTK